MKIIDRYGFERMLTFNIIITEDNFIDIEGYIFNFKRIFTYDNVDGYVSYFLNFYDNFSSEHKQIIENKLISDYNIIIDDSI